MMKKNNVGFYIQIPKGKEEKRIRYNFLIEALEENKFKATKDLAKKCKTSLKILRYINNIYFFGDRDLSNQLFTQTGKGISLGDAIVKSRSLGLRYNKLNHPLEYILNACGANPKNCVIRSIKYRILANILMDNNFKIGKESLISSNNSRALLENIGFVLKNGSKDFIHNFLNQSKGFKINAFEAARKVRKSLSSEKEKKEDLLEAFILSLFKKNPGYLFLSDLKVQCSQFLERHISEEEYFKIFRKIFSESKTTFICDVCVDAQNVCKFGIKKN